MSLEREIMHPKDSVAAVVGRRFAGGRKEGRKEGILPVIQSAVIDWCTPFTVLDFNLPSS